MLHTISLLLFLASVSIGGVDSHQESGAWSCDSNSEIRLQADFKPGLITLDGHADDWKDIDGSDFSLVPALDPDADKEFKGGKMTVKTLHDGRDIFFLLEVDGIYAYSKGNSNKCPSVALMFQIGDGASYHNMGSCEEHASSCTNKTCKGHEVDIMHFSIGNAIPGRLYGGNPVDNRDRNGRDRFGHLVDLYAWNPHCRYLDGLGPSGSVNDSSAQNDWKGAWWHSSFTVHSGFVEDESPYAENGKKGTFFFEFSRPLRTMDHLQQEVGWDSNKPGYDGLIEVVNRLMMKGRTRADTIEAAVRVLRSLFPPFLLELYKMLIAPIGGGKVAAMMVARVTAVTCQWLMGPCKVNSVDLDSGASCSSGVYVERCKYLEESKCASICINTCKFPTQTFFMDHMGVPLLMEPNFSDYSCQFKFGVLPPQPENDGILKEPCLEACPLAAKRRVVASNKDEPPCPKI